jgi:hypothetical protein
MYDPRSSSHGYLLTLTLPGEDEDSCYFDKLDILELQGMQASHSFVLKRQEPPTDEMLAFLRLMNVRGASMSCFSAERLLIRVVVYRCSAMRSAIFQRGKRAKVARSVEMFLGRFKPKRSSWS